MQIQQYIDKKRIHSQINSFAATHCSPLICTKNEISLTNALSLCRGHSWRVRLAKQETLTPPGYLVSPLVCWGPWMSTVVLYCWCHSDSASVLLYFTLLRPQVHKIATFRYTLKALTHHIFSIIVKENQTSPAYILRKQVFMCHHKKHIRTIGVISLYYA